MLTHGLAWYCARTKQKQDHIAAANLRKNLGLEVFHPRLRVERSTRRGVVRSIEPLFPCYVFVRCVLGEKLNEIRYTTGISTLVHFGHGIPVVPDAMIEELRECFAAEEPMTVDDPLAPSVEVMVVEGAFAGMRASVLKAMPAKRRVQILLDVLGRPTQVEVDRGSVTRENVGLADLVPVLAVHREMLRA